MKIGIGIRIGHLLMAFVLCFLLCAGGLDLTVSAASTITTIDNVVVRNTSGSQIEYIGYNSTVSLTFDYVDNDTNITSDGVYRYTSSNVKFNTTHWTSSASTPMTIRVVDQNSDNSWNMRVTLDTLKYHRSDKSNTMKIETTSTGYAPKFDFEIPEDFFTRSSGGGGGGDDVDNYSSEIRIENAYLTDSDGQRLDNVTKEYTGLFNIVVIYSDYGLREVDVEEMASTDFEAYLTSSGGFVPTKGNRGTLKPTTSNSSDAPRFRAEFKNLTYDGGTNSITFEARYNIDGYDVKSEASTTLHAATGVEEDEDKDKIPPPKPNIIVSQYSYGDIDASIVAGTDFKLETVFQNTSKDIPLENIVMTLKPDDKLSIAAASNTYYIESLAAGASLSYNLDLWVKPNAEVGSSSIAIDFAYEYIDEINKKRESGTSSETIAIPITQIDRFEVDPITDSPYGVIGEEVYITVSFVNRGKSITYNISGTATGNLDILAPVQHFGNLNPGESESLDMVVIPQESGELYGEIVIQYEDENTHQKEVIVPFNMYVEEPWVPPVDEFPDDWNPDDFAEPKPPLWNIILCVIGGILIAVPIALYLMKRVKAKGSEDFDEDF